MFALTVTWLGLCCWRASPADISASTHSLLGVGDHTGVAKGRVISVVLKWKRPGSLEAAASIRPLPLGEAARARRSARVRSESDAEQPGLPVSQLDLFLVGSQDLAGSVGCTTNSNARPSRSRTAAK